MIDALQVCTTIDDRDAAERIAEALVARRLAACVQITGPVTSVYRWEGKIESNQEWLCIVKTVQSRYAAVEAAIRELHTYQVPEIVAVPIVAGSASYLDWLRQETVEG
jgi:periplasmic divalent cation tolerance protein